MKRRMLVSAALALLCWTAAAVGPGMAAYRVQMVLYPGDDGASVAKRLAAAYRGTLETAVDANGAFTIALSTAGAKLMGRDPAVERLEVADATVSTEGVVESTAVATPWKLGNYEYDGSGNIRRIGAAFFVYDTRNRLVVSADASTSSVVPKQTYAYDTFGNQTAINTTGVGQTTLTVDTSSNQVTTVSSGVAAVSPAYDATGNLTQYGTATYAYDALNVLTRSTVDGVTRYYVYSANDERIGTVELSTSGTRSDWTIRDAAGQVLRRLSRESNGEWKWQEDYIYRGNQMLAAEIPDSTRTRHFHLDHLGTPRLITGNGGVEISRHSYHPFGVEIAPTSTSTTTIVREKKQFTGHERDAASLDYMHARFYAPYMGRFLSVDPELDVKAALLRPQRWNRYSYLSNNPVNKIDTTGKYEEDVHQQLTYALARAAGFSPSQAGAIAGADQGVDDSPETSPFKSTEVRAAYHFTTSDRRAQMWGAFETSGSLTALGQFFHAQQDSYSHAGYGPKVGHGAAGHGPDKTYNDPAKAMKMALDTYSRLNQAADKLGVPRKDRAAWGQIQSAVGAFIKARTEKEKDAAIQRLIGVIAAAQQ